MLVLFSLFFQCTSTTGRVVDAVTALLTLPHTSSCTRDRPCANNTTAVASSASACCVMAAATEVAHARSCTMSTATEPAGRPLTSAAARK